MRGVTQRTWLWWESSLQASLISPIAVRQWPLWKGASHPLPPSQVLGGKCWSNQERMETEPRTFEGVGPQGLCMCSKYCVEANRSDSWVTPHSCMLPAFFLMHVALIINRGLCIPVFYLSCMHNEAACFLFLGKSHPHQGEGAWRGGWKCELRGLFSLV